MIRRRLAVTGGLMAAMHDPALDDFLSPEGFVLLFDGPKEFREPSDGDRSTRHKLHRLLKDLRFRYVTWSRFVASRAPWWEVDEWDGEKGTRFDLERAGISWRLVFIRLPEGILDGSAFRQIDREWRQPFEAEMRELESEMRSLSRPSEVVD